LSHVLQLFVLRCVGLFFDPQTLTIKENSGAVHTVQKIVELHTVQLTKHDVCGLTCPDCFLRWLLSVYTKWTVFIKYLFIKGLYKVLNALFCMYGPSLCYCVSVGLFCTEAYCIHL